MFFRQGRTHHFAAVSHGSAAAWGDGPLHEVRLLKVLPRGLHKPTLHTPLGPVIGHIGRRTPRSTSWPACDEKYYATTCTDPTALPRARWWSRFTDPRTAEAFLLGHWMALHPDDPYPEPTAATATDDKEPAR